MLGKAFARVGAEPVLSEVEGCPHLPKHGTGVGRRVLGLFAHRSPKLNRRAKILVQPASSHQKMKL